MSFQNVVLGNEYLPVDPAITAIMVRELIEGCMFCVTHIGAVLKNDLFTKEQKRKYLLILIPAILTGVSIGLLVAIGIGVSLVYAVAESSNTQYGIEVGEGVSRMIGAFFVTDLTIKIPKWFKISNYEEPKKEGEGNPSDFGQRWEIGFSLFWNVLRESIEGGALTAVAVVLSDQSKNALGASVGVAFAATFVLSLFFSLGAKYISSKLFGVLAAALAQLLAMGLWTGMTKSFQEVDALRNGRDEDQGASPVIYNHEGTTYGDSLTILEFIGFSSILTRLTLAIWLLSFVLISFAQFWHNYLGKPFIPHWMKAACKRRVNRCNGKVKMTLCPPKKGKDTAKQVDDAPAH